MGTNSWTRLFEVLAEVDGSINESALYRGSVKALLLCEAPGAFICALNHYVKGISSSKADFQWFSSTLNPKCAGIVSFSLSRS